MQVNIQLPQALESNDINSIEDVSRYYSQATEYVHPIAVQAFKDGDQLSWAQIQHILYYYNTRDVERIVDPLSFQAVAERAVRNYIVGIQNQYSEDHNVELDGPFSVDLAIETMKSQALDHRINTHPLFDMMNNGLSKDEIRVFLDNYYVNNRLFHLHLATLSLATPLVKRNDLFANLYDELGCDDVENAHPILFLKNYDFVGESESIDPTPGTLHLMNTKIQITHLCSDYREGFGGFGFIEISMPVQMRAILSGLTKSGMNAEQTIFWDLHISIDERHGESWFHEMRELINNEDDYRTVLNAGIQLLDARCALYDDVYSTIERMRSKADKAEQLAV
jgi:pyrroloquinoline quinone (PQQ) biosynthesis protein C